MSSSRPEDTKRSGLNKEWTEGLADLTPQQCHDYINALSTMPIKSCDAKRGCENPVEWWVWFHGCDAESVCDDCLKMWVFEVNRALSEQGEVPCTDCGESFTTLRAIMKWRVI